jgi:hypothetical protein
MAPLPATLKYVARFPENVDNFFRPCDDAIIRCVQFPIESPARFLLVSLSKLITIMTSIEIGFSVPLFLFLLEKYDRTAIFATYDMLVMAFATQIPKRFLWRARPHTVSRSLFALNPSDEGHSDTSSFPSRAVIGAVVYSSFMGAVLEAHGSAINSVLPTQLLTWLLIVSCAVLTSIARVLIGNKINFKKVFFLTRVVPFFLSFLLIIF